MRAGLALVAVALLLIGCGGSGSGTLPSLPGTSNAGTTTEPGTSSEAPAATDDGTSSESATTEESPSVTEADTVTATLTVTETAPATTADVAAPDPAADRRIARDGLVQRVDLPSGLGFKGVSLPGAASRCFRALARQADAAAGATGRQYIGNRSTSIVMSLSWSFRDADAATAALDAIATTDAVDCLGKQQTRGAAPTVKYLGASDLDFPTVGDATIAFRADYKVEGKSSASDDVFVRTGRVVTAAAFQQVGGAPKQSTVKSVLERVSARVADAG